MNFHKLLLTLTGCVCVATVAVQADDDTYSPNANLDYPTKLLFGETHLHSALSADAGGGGTTLMPRDLYRFARGERCRCC